MLVGPNPITALYALGNEVALTHALRVNADPGSPPDAVLSDWLLADANDPAPSICPVVAVAALLLVRFNAGDVDPLVLNVVPSAK